MQGNHQPYAALVQRQMLPAQVQGNHVYQPWLCCSGTTCTGSPV
jgi:hypothetical protein